MEYVSEMKAVHRSMVQQSKLQQLQAFKARQPVEGSCEAIDLNRKLREKSIRDSTRQQYECAGRYYEEICSFPISGEKLQSFVRALLELEPPLAGDTISQYVSAVRTLSEIRGERALDETEVKQVERAVTAAKKMRESEGKKRKKATVMEDEIVEAIMNLECAEGSLDDQLKTVTLLAISTVCRLDEVYQLRGRDVEVKESQDKIIVVVKIWNPKTEDGLTTKEIECDSVGFRVPGLAKCGVTWCPAHEIKKTKEYAQVRLSEIVSECGEDHLFPQAEGDVEEKVSGNIGNMELRRDNRT